METKIYECDDELKKQSKGDKYFIPYAEDTKLRTFKTKKEAERFLEIIKFGEKEK